MIGTIETVDVQINGDIFQLTKLYARDSYALFMKCTSIVSPLINSLIKNFRTSNTDIDKLFSNLEIDAQQVINTICEKFSFDEVLRLLKASGVRKNYKEITDADWNVCSPFLIMELFAKVIEINIWKELSNKKKDLEERQKKHSGLESSIQM